MRIDTFLSINVGLSVKSKLETYSKPKNHYQATLIYWCCLFL